MKAKDINIGSRYYAKVSGTVQVVRVLRTVERFGFNDNGRTHWVCVNEATKREIEVKSCQRFRRPVGDRPADGEPGPKSLSELFRL